MAIKSYKIENFLQSPAVVHVFDAIDSTNNEAKRRALTDPDCAVLYVTDCQTAGRGRRGHDFYSPKGSGLYFTLSLPLCGYFAGVQLMTCAAGVAVCEAIFAQAGRAPEREVETGRAFMGNRWRSHGFPRRRRTSAQRAGT